MRALAYITAGHEQRHLELIEESGRRLKYG